VSAGGAAAGTPIGRGLRRALYILLGLAIVLTAGYTWFVLKWNYATGEHAGWVQTLSRKGWLCKTWEGELAIISVPGTLPEKFSFTVSDDALAAQINRLNGHRVALEYEQKVGVPSKCFGETPYFVTGVRPVEDLPAPSFVPPSASGQPAGPSAQQPPEPAGQLTVPSVPSVPSVPPSETPGSRP
jgi:hypothetical protein